MRNEMYSKTKYFGGSVPNTEGFDGTLLLLPALPTLRFPSPEGPNAEPCAAGDSKEKGRDVGVAKEG